MERHLWPGNVRELENVIERAVVLAESDRVTLLDLPVEVASPRFGWQHRSGETKPHAHHLSAVGSRGPCPTASSNIMRLSARFVR